MSGNSWGTRGTSRRTGGRRTPAAARRRLPATLLSAALAAGLALAGISAPADAAASAEPGTTADTAAPTSTTAPAAATHSTTPSASTATPAPPAGGAPADNGSTAPEPTEPDDGTPNTTPDTASGAEPDTAAAPAGTTLVVEQRWVVNGLEATAESARSYGASAVPVLAPAPEGGQPAFGQEVPGTAGQETTVRADVTTGDRCRVLSRTAAVGNASDTTAAAAPLADGGNAVVLAAGANTVTTTFTLECDGTLTLAKRVVNDDGGTATAADWELSATGADGTAHLAAVRSGSGAATGPVRPGSYTLTEAAGTGGYGPSALACTVDGNPASGVGPGTPTVEVGIGQNVVCTFSGNDAPPRLKLTQNVAGAPAALARHWTLSATAADGTLQASGDGGTDGFVDVRGGTELRLERRRNASFPTPYAAEFTDGGAWRCVDARTGAAYPVSAAGTIRLQPGEQVECTTGSSFNGVAPTVEKSVESVRQRADGSWDVAYRLRVANPSSVVAVAYDLDDTLGFGSGLAPRTATATGPGARAAWDGGNDTRLATAQTLAAGSAAEYRVEVNADVASGAYSSGAAACTPSGGGFHATAALRVGGERVDGASACSEPVRPSFTQTSLGLHKHVVDGTWDGTWDATYRMTVANPGDAGQRLSYDLANSPVLPAGVELVQRRVDSAAGDLSTGWSAQWESGESGALVSGRGLDAGAGEEYTVTLNVAFTAGIASGARDCAPGSGGVRALATLSAGGTDTEEASCLGIPRATLEVDTEATSALENGDGTWTVGYTVAVRNAGEVPAAYDLAHTLRYANGFTALAGRWTLAGTEEAGRWDDPAGAPTAVLADGREIAPGADAGFTVEVTARVAPDVVDRPAGRCGAGGGGFAAAVELAVDGSTQMAEACTEPYDNPRSYAVSMSSDPANGTDVAPGDVVTFTVSARNTGDFVYRGAVVTGETAGWQQYGEMVPGSLRTTAGRTEADGTKLVWTVGDLPAGRTASMTYQVKVHDEASDVVLENEVTATGIAAPVRTAHFAASMPRLAPVNLLPVPAAPAADGGPGQELVIALVGGLLLLAAGGSALVGTRRKSW